MGDEVNHPSRYQSGAGIEMNRVKRCVGCGMLRPFSHFTRINDRRPDKPYGYKAKCQFCHRGEGAGESLMAKLKKLPASKLRQLIDEYSAHERACKKFGQEPMPRWEWVAERLETEPLPPAEYVGPVMRYEQYQPPRFTEV